MTVACMCVTQPRHSTKYGAVTRYLIGTMVRRVLRAALQHCAHGWRRGGGWWVVVSSHPYMRRAGRYVCNRGVCGNESWRSVLPRHRDRCADLAHRPHGAFVAWRAAIHQQGQAPGCCRTAPCYNPDECMRVCSNVKVVMHPSLKIVVVATNDKAVRLVDGATGERCISYCSLVHLTCAPFALLHQAKYCEASTRTRAPWPVSPWTRPGCS